MRHRLEFVGWLLFLFSAFGFTIESWLSRSWWALAGSVLFLLGVIVFLIPTPPTVPSAEAVLSAALPDDPLPSADELLTAMLAADPGEDRAGTSAWLADDTAPSDGGRSPRSHGSSWSDDDGVVEPRR